MEMQVVEHIAKISVIQKCSFLAAASDIFNAKVSGTLKRYVIPVPCSWSAYISFWDVFIYK